ncbi:hypothetical protein MKOR_34560 [Mycolicibacillus koreensis]|nr:hypothetical protein MKOR_34560 [Mycolicibacillus koreensis]
MTLLSVLCADKMVATANSSGVVKSSSQCASGKARANVRFIRRARRTSPRRVSALQSFGLDAGRSRLATLTLIGY